MLLVLGDSNFRNTIEQFGAEMRNECDEEVKFVMTTSNESTKVQLENRTDSPKIVVVGPPLNEIVYKYNENRKRGRAETIKEVIEEQNKLIRQAAAANPGVIFLIVPPFLRNEPAWIKERISLGIFHVRDFVGDDGPWNVTVANPIKITEDDLVDDGVHLNTQGKLKLRKSLVADILVCKENLGDGANNIDWSSQLSTSEPPTPATLRKRARPAEEDNAEDEDEQTGSKKAKLDTMLDKIDMLVKEIKSDRISTNTKVQELSAKADKNSEDIAEVKTIVSTLQKNSNQDHDFTAEVREDLDSLENENLKSTVIVRKLKADDVPKDKKALKAYVQTKGRELVKSIAGEEIAGSVKYVATLYSFIDPQKKDNMAGLIPPIKIGFGSKDSAVKFRDLAVKKSKEAGSIYKDTYFSFFQSFGTKIRSLIMWGIVDQIKTGEREAWVNQAAAKPTLQIKEGGRIVKSLTYVKAIKEYRDKIPAKTLDEATKLAKKHFAGKIEKSFIVIKD
jgi:hypothetical protein